MINNKLRQKLIARCTACNTHTGTTGELMLCEFCTVNSILKGEQ